MENNNLDHLEQNPTVQIISAEQPSFVDGYKFRSIFLAKTDLSVLKSLLTEAFRKVAGSVNETENESYIINLGLLYAHFLNQANLQNQLNLNEAQYFLTILDTHSRYKINLDQLGRVLNEPEPLKDFLMNYCTELQYVLLCQFIKFCHPNVRLDVTGMNNTRFEKITHLQVPTPRNVERIKDNYVISNNATNVVLLLERCGLAITVGTMTFTHYMMDEFKYYLDNTGGGWVYYYRNKILRNMIMPFIQLIMSNYQCDVDKKKLLKLLIDFSSDIKLPDEMDPTSLKSTLRFIESMVEEDNNNLENLKRFVKFLDEHDYPVVQKRNHYIIKISDETITITYNE